MHLTDEIRASRESLVTVKPPQCSAANVSYRRRSLHIHSGHCRATARKQHSAVHRTRYAPGLFSATLLPVHIEPRRSDRITLPPPNRKLNTQRLVHFKTQHSTRTLQGLYCTGVMHLGSVNVIGFCTVYYVYVCMFICPCNICFCFMRTPGRLATIAVEASGDMNKEMKFRDGCKWSALRLHCEGEESDVEEVLSSNLVVALQMERTASSILVVPTLRVVQKELLCHSVQIQHQRKAISSHILQCPPILVIASF